MKPIEPINFTRGDTYRFDFSFPLDGAKYKLNAGDVIRLFVFKGRQKVITKLLSIANQGADGTITVVFNPEDTSSLRPGTYEYERELITADGRTETICRMPFIIYEDLITPENRGSNVPPSSEPQAWLQARSVSYENTRSSLRSKNLQAAVDEIDGKLRDIEIPERSEIISTGIGSSIILDCASDRHLRGLTLYGKTTQNGIPSPTNPIPLVSAGGIGSINTSIVGKNLLPYPYPFVTYTTNSVTATVNNDGSVTLSGTAMADAYIYLTPYSASYDTGFKAPAGTVYVSGCPAGGSATSYRMQVSAYKNGAYAAGTTDIGNGASFQNKTEYIIACYIHVRAGTNVDGLTFRPMISMEQGAAFTQTTAQTLTAQTPNGLNGVPVTSGGNYTDESGQQWICDEIDFGRGVYLQNTRRFTINGSAAQSISSITVRQNTVRFWVYGADPGGGGELPSKAKNIILCDKLPYGDSYASGHDTVSIMCGAAAGYPTSFVVSLPITTGTTAAAISAYLAANPLDVVYALAEPIETPLTAAEIAAYKALHTNKPVTTILNNSGNGMKVTYVPDNPAAIYLDKRLSDIEAAIISTGGNI